MKYVALALLAGVAAPLFAQAGGHQGHSMDMAAPTQAQILHGYGDGGFKITTRSEQAQAYFNNGMQLAHAFAHKAAVAAMQEAERLDPSCAMCVWGEAWAGGPTINFGKEGDELDHITVLAAKARRLARVRGTPKERALIDALVARYRNGGGGKPGDLTFAKAVQRLSGRYPDDDELATIAADGWLIALAHNTPASDSDAGRHAIPLLERVLKRNPDYTPAIHFYIHATEAVNQPGLAERYADRLAALAPNASHLIHMPSHSFYWVGRYQDAATANARAVEIGIAQAKSLNLPAPDGLWGLPYHVHNITYGIGGALMAGDAATALRLGRPLVTMAAARTEEGAYRQIVASEGYFALARFAGPQEALAAPKPKLPILTGSWHYMRGEAYAALHRPMDTLAEAAAIGPLPGTPNADDGMLNGARLLDIERLVLRGRAALLLNRPAEALECFEQASAIQEDEGFAAITDPPAFWYPVKRSVAEAKLALGDMSGARAALRQSLKLRPRDPAAMAMLAKLEAATAAR
jgi:tetratricopeptide (TPR) repeat protein